MSEWPDIFRNNPFLVLIGAVLLMVVLFILAFQIFYRGAPLACGDMILPSSKSDCPEVKIVPVGTQVPVGTIVAYFGKDEDIPSGWALCDGQNNPNESKITIDANSEKGGIQLPDLRNRFIRGSNQALAESHVKKGGNDTITLEHAHLWAHFRPRQWFSFDENSHYHRIDNWNNGLGDEGENNFPLQVYEGRDKKLYTQRDTTIESNLPSYVELRFIIRIF